MKRLLNLLGYGAGSLGVNLVLWPLSDLLMYFLTETVGFSVALAILVITAPKVWDIFVDPLIGAWAGRAAARNGNRMRVLMLAAGMMPASVVLVFLLPEHAPAWLAAVAVLLMIVKSCAFMVFFVSEVGLADDMDRSGLVRRDTVLAMRVVGQALGTLIAGAAGPLIISELGGGQRGYLIMAIVMALAGVLGMMAVAWMAKGFRTAGTTASADEKPAGSSLLDAIRAAMHNRSAGLLIVSNFMLYIAASVVATFLPYMNKLILGAGDSTLSILFTSMTVAMLIGSGIAAVATRRMGRHQVLLAGVLIMTAAAALFYPGTTVGGISAASAVLLLWGLGLGIYSLVIFSAMMDAGAGAVGAGLLLGLLMSTGKVGDTLGGVLAGGMLSWAGYHPGVAIGPDTIQDLRLAYCGIPLGAMLLAALALLPLLRRPSSALAPEPNPS